MYLSLTTHGDRIQTRAAGRFVLYESSYAAGTALPQHYHDVAALMFATRGSFEERVAGRRLECAPFDVIVRPAGEVHTDLYDRAGGTSCVIANFEPELARFFAAPALLPRARVAPIASRVAAELATDDDAAPVVVEGLLLELIGTAARPVRSVRAPSWLARARDFVHANAAAHITLNDIAAAAGVHPASVVRAFRRNLQCSPGEYVRRVRIDTARAALASSTATIADIALAAGFYDQSHFANAFRRATGMTPREYRNACGVQN